MTLVSLSQEPSPISIVFQAQKQVRRQLVEVYFNGSFILVLCVLLASGVTASHRGLVIPVLQ